MTWVTNLKTKALAAIAAGNGQMRALTSASENGKAFTADVVLTNLDVADITISALAEAESGSAGAEGVTIPDFSR